MSTCKIYESDKLKSFSICKIYRCLVVIIKDIYFFRHIVIPFKQMLSLYWFWLLVSIKRLGNKPKSDFVELRLIEVVLNINYKLTDTELILLSLNFYFLESIVLSTARNNKSILERYSQT